MTHYMKGNLKSHLSCGVGNRKHGSLSIKWDVEEKWRGQTIFLWKIIGKGVQNNSWPVLTKYKGLF